MILKMMIIIQTEEKTAAASAEQALMTTCQIVNYHPIAVLLLVNLLMQKLFAAAGNGEM